MDYQSILLFFSLFFLSFCLLLFKSNILHQSHNPIRSGLKPYPIIGNLPQFLKNRHRFHDWIAETLAAAPSNTITFHRPGNIRGIITANSANVEHMLRSNFDNYPKGPRFISILEDFLGRGIFNSDGHLWKLQRKTASFEFNTRSLRTFVVRNVQQEIATRLLPLLKKSAVTAQIIDVQDVFECFAFDNVCKVAFNHDPACLAGETDQNLSSGFALAFRDAANLSAGRFLYAVPGFWKVTKLFGIGSERRLLNAIETVHDFATKIIKSRMKEITEISSDDLLSRFILSGENSEEFLRDIVISFILAGRDTTSSALTWFFWLLSSRPEVEIKILKEIASIRARAADQKSNYSSMLELEELREMHYLHAALSEAMRLYPPVPVNTTACQEDDVLPDGTSIKKGWFMSYSSYAMGRMEKIWGKDCGEYRPERWLEGDGLLFRPESPFKFPAFHAGPRMCLGKEMAYIQMMSVAACVLENFVVEVINADTVPEQMLSLTLRMKGGLAVRVKSRCAAN